MSTRASCVGGTPTQPIGHVPDTLNLRGMEEAVKELASALEAFTGLSPFGIGLQPRDPELMLHYDKRSFVAGGAIPARWSCRLQLRVRSLTPCSGSR